MPDTISELWIQTYSTTIFQYNILCILTLGAWKLQVVYGHSTYRITALLSKMPIFCVRAGCEIRMVSYGSKHAQQSFSDKPFVHIYLSANFENFKSYDDIEHMKRLLCYRRHSLCGLELHERSDWRATAPDMHRSFSDTTLCAYTASPYIHRYMVHNYAWQQNSRTLLLHTTHQMMALLPMFHSFLRTKLASYCTRSSVF